MDKPTVDPARAEAIDRYITNMFILMGHAAEGELVSVQIPWHEVYAILPRKTIRGKWVWLRTLYKRRVWRVTGLIQEPVNEYGDVFDIL